MDCKGKYEQLPQVDVRVKAWTPIFLPNPWLKVEADLKIVFNIKSVAAAIGQTTEAEPIDDDHVHSVAVQFDMDMLTIIPKPIRDMLVHETWYTLTYARRLLVFSRDLAQNRKPNRNLKAGCCLKCNACRDKVLAPALSIAGANTLSTTKSRRLGTSRNSSGTFRNIYGYHFAVNFGIY
eukprot:Em0019g1017a